MSILKNITEYKQYFSDIVTDHKLLSGFNYGDVDSAISYTNSNDDGSDGYIMWLEPYSAKPKLREDSKNVGKVGSLVVMHPWESGNWTNDEDVKFKSQTALETVCEQIVIDIISRIKRDNDANDVQTEFNNFVWDFIDVTFTGNYVGVRLELDYNHGQNFCYIEDNWVSPVVVPIFSDVSKNFVRLSFSLDDETSVTDFELFEDGISLAPGIPVIPSIGSLSYFFDGVTFISGREYVVVANLSDTSTKSSKDDGQSYIHP